MPQEQLIWQDRFLRSVIRLSMRKTSLRSKRLCFAADLAFRNWVQVAWASAATFRGGDKRVGQTVHGYGWLSRKKTGEVNQPELLAKVLRTLEGIKQQFDSAQLDGKTDIACGSDCAGWLCCD